MNVSSDVRPFLVLLTIGLIWGSSFLYIKVLVDEISPIEVAAGRIFFGMLAIGAFVLITRQRIPLSPGLVGKVAVLAAVANIAPFSLIAWGQQHIDSGVAAVLNSTMPIWTSIVAAAFLVDERFTVFRLLGLTFGFVGVIVLTGDDILNITDSSVLGQLAIVGAAFCYATGSVYTRRLLGTSDPQPLVLIQIICAMVMSVPLVFIVEGGPGYNLSLEGVLALLALGGLGTGVAYLLFYYLIDNIGSVRASLVTYIVPVLALILGWIVLDESIGVNLLVGAALIIGGVASVMRGHAPSVQRRAAEPAALAPLGAAEQVDS